jgi:hypothetical protein
MQKFGINYKAGAKDKQGALNLSITIQVVYGKVHRYQPGTQSSI